MVTCHGMLDINVPVDLWHGHGDWGAVSDSAADDPVMGPDDTCRRTGSDVARPMSYVTSFAHQILTIIGRSSVNLGNRG